MAVTILSGWTPLVQSGLFGLASATYTIQAMQCIVQGMQGVWNHVSEVPHYCVSRDWLGSRYETDKTLPWATALSESSTMIIADLLWQLGACSLTREDQEIV